MSKEFGKVSLDLDRLIEEQVIEPALAQRLFELKAPSHMTNQLISALYIIGALAAAAGVVLLKPTATTGLLIGVACLIAGQFIRWRGWQHLNILALALGIGSAAGITGWLVLEFGETFSGITINAIATAITLIIALLFRSRFMAAIVPLGIGSIIGSGAAYWHASYGIFVREAALSIALFVPLFALLTWFVSRSRHPDWNPMATMAARMSFIVANFGFWVGSLWGDHIGEHFFRVWNPRVNQKWQEWSASLKEFRDSTLFINEYVFAIGWAGFSIAAIMIGRRLQNRFIEISGIVFLAINAFTQYFEYFRDEPWALIIGGIGLVAIALALVRYEMSKRHASVKVPELQPNHG